MHPTEWNAGESAGRLAAFCIENDVAAKQVESDPRALRRFQAYLVKWGVPIFWFVDVPQEHAAFAAAQLLGAWGQWPVARQSLQFEPARPVSASEARAMLRAVHLDAATASEILARANLAGPGGPVPAAELAQAWLAAIYPAE
jgi:hypothetical protein